MCVFFCIFCDTPDIGSFYRHIHWLHLCWRKLSWRLKYFPQISQENVTSGLLWVRSCIIKLYGLVKRRWQNLHTNSHFGRILRRKSDRRSSFSIRITANILADFFFLKLSRVLLSWVLAVVGVHLVSRPIDRVQNTKSGYTWMCVECVSPLSRRFFCLLFLDEFLAQSLRSLGVFVLVHLFYFAWTANWGGRRSCQSNKYSENII